MSRSILDILQIVTSLVGTLDGFLLSFGNREYYPPHSLLTKSKGLAEDTRANLQELESDLTRRDIRDLDSKVSLLKRRLAEYLSFSLLPSRIPNLTLGATSCLLKWMPKSLEEGPTMEELPAGPPSPSRFRLSSPNWRR